MLPDTGFLRIARVIGDPKKGIAGLFPRARTAWYAGIRSGRYPSPVRLGPRISAWRVEDIRDMLEKFGGTAK